MFSAKRPLATHFYALARSGTILALRLLIGLTPANVTAPAPPPVPVPAPTPIPRPEPLPPCEDPPTEFDVPPVHPDFRSCQ